MKLNTAMVITLALVPAMFACKDRTDRARTGTSRETVATRDLPTTETAPGANPTIVPADRDRDNAGGTGKDTVVGKNDQAVEEYVKLTYLYPDNPLVADATIRLGNYYLKQNSFKTAGKIFSSFLGSEQAHYRLEAEYPLSDGRTP